MVVISSDSVLNIILNNPSIITTSKKAERVGTYAYDDLSETWDDKSYTYTSIGFTVSSSDIYLSNNEGSIIEGQGTDFTVSSSLLNIASLANGLSIDSLIGTNVPMMTLVTLAPIIPTWRWPYVGCQEVLFPYTIEEVIKLKLYEDEISISIDQEEIILSIDC